MKEFDDMLAQMKRTNNLLAILAITKIGVNAIPALRLVGFTEPDIDVLLEATKHLFVMSGFQEEVLEETTAKLGFVVDE